MADLLRPKTEGCCKPMLMELPKRRCASKTAGYLVSFLRVDYDDGGNDLFQNIKPYFCNKLEMPKMRIALQ